VTEHGDEHAGRDIGSVDFDLVVIGAGPAGSVAACSAARRGLRVALVDRSTFPRDKTCGDGIGPGAVRVLRSLGLDGVLEGRSRVATFTVFGPAGERSDNPVPAIPGKSTDIFVVPRLEFDEYLFRAALDSGAEDFTGMRYLGMSEPDGRVRTVELRDGSGAHRTLRAHLVIGADGAYSVVRKDLLGQRGQSGEGGQRTQGGESGKGSPGGQDRPNPKDVGVAMRGYAECRGFEADGDAGPSILFEFSRDLLPSYGWIFPVGGGTINIGVGLPTAQLRARNVDLRQLLTDFAERLRGLGIEVGELREVRAHQLRGVADMPRLAFGRAALIGDAASMINPVSGEGIAYAMTAALRLIEALPAELADGPALDAALERFERKFRADHRLHFLSSRLTMALLRHAVSAGVIVRAIQKDPRVLGGVFDMLFGDGRLQAGTALRIVRRALVR
jgi:flavin-dependent dehydrogenase